MANFWRENGCGRLSTFFLVLTLTFMYFENFPFATSTLSVMHFVYLQKNLHKHCFHFLLRLTIVPREIEDNAYANFFGVNKVHYGLMNVEMADV